MAITRLVKIECDGCGEQIVMEIQNDETLKSMDAEMYSGAEEAGWELDLKDYCAECLKTHSAESAEHAVELVEDFRTGGPGRAFHTEEKE